jgi:hypothetical protein
MTSNKNKKWIPEIMYQEGSEIPFIEVPVGQEMPSKFFIWEYKNTGEFEPGPSGEDVPICDTMAHIYFNYGVAKKVLSPELLDTIRVAFGLEPIEKATKKGKEITDRVIANAAKKPTENN